MAVKGHPPAFIWVFASFTFEAVVSATAASAPIKHGTAMLLLDVLPTVLEEGTARSDRNDLDS